MRFILLDRVDHMDPGHEARGVKSISLADNVFDEHFPEYPLFPGTLIVEAMAQLGGFLCECTYHARNPDTRRAVLMQVRNAKFHHPSRPGDRLDLVARLENELDTACRIAATASVDGKTVSEASLTFRLVGIDAPGLHAHRQALYRQWLQGQVLDCPIR